MSAFHWLLMPSLMAAMASVASVWCTDPHSAALPTRATEATPMAAISIRRATMVNLDRVCESDSTPMASASGTDDLGWGHDGRRCPSLGARARQGQRLRAYPVRA